MKIEKISTECSEISMEVHPDGLNIMGMIHGGLLYSLADVVTGLTARADGRKYVTQSAHVNFIANVSGEGDCPGDPGAQGPGHYHHRPRRRWLDEEREAAGRCAAADMYCVG